MVDRILKIFLFFKIFFNKQFLSKPRKSRKKIENSIQFYEHFVAQFKRMV